MRSLAAILILILSAFSSCVDKGDQKIIVFHAGSLARPFSLLAEEYEAANPGTKILLEAAGSLVSARKITELNRSCDIMASADYQVIDALLVPDYASWNLGFATNEIVIAYNDKSTGSDIIDGSNWTEILLRPDVIFGRSDPDSDPCGYRTVIALVLANNYFGLSGLKEAFLEKNTDFIRPKETDLLALLESGVVDYIFQYKSVAVQHSLKYLRLPDEVNLGNPSFTENYRSVSIPVTGSKPGETITMQGDYIMYGITLLNDAPNTEGAIDFLAFIVGPRGREIFKLEGQNSINPPIISGPGVIPYAIVQSINKQ
jgi:molybdate/tungstate transport system substrate-binding protein